MDKEASKKPVPRDRITALLGRTALMDGSLRARRAYLTQELAALLDADGWMWAVSCYDETGAAPTVMESLHGGLSEEQLASYFDAEAARQAPLPIDEPIRKRLARGRPITVTRQELVDDDTWFSHGTVKTYLLERGLGDVLFSLTPLEGGLCAGMAFFRFTGRRSFGLRERNALRMAAAALPDSPPELAQPHKEQTLHLSERKRLVLSLLLEGYGRQDIAGFLHLSELTVKDYIKAVYHHFDVSSHLELIRLFRTR